MKDEGCTAVGLTGVLPEFGYTGRGGVVMLKSVTIEGVPKPIVHSIVREPRSRCMVS